jgi:DNA primase
MTWLDDLTTGACGRLNERVLDALSARGVSEQQIATYGLGYLNKELPDADYPQAFLKWSDGGAKLDDVLVLPLTNTIGTIRGVQFRYVSRDRAGYMDFIEGKDEAVLFGLAQAMPHVWATRSVYLVEGGFDLFPVQRVFPGVVATLTARVTEPFLRILRRLVERIWLGYDADETGRRVSKRFRESHGHEFGIRTISYPTVPMIGTDKLTKDPGDLWETWGDVRFQEYLRTQLGSDDMETHNAQSLR